jgi:hypothetical protein
MHNWGAYGGGYFADPSGQMNYLSSSMWCDNFVIQDDNFGPFYHLSSRFLIDYIEYARSRNAFEKHMMGRNQILPKTWYEDPMYAVFVHPKKVPFTEHSCLIEPTAVSFLYQHVANLSSSHRRPKKEEFNLFFYDNFNYKRHSLKRLEQNIITRTLIVKKSEYLETTKDIYIQNKKLDLIDYALPDFFWIIEISVPELYWINKRKVGEIIIDPDIFLYNKQNSLVLIRLPYKVSLFKEGVHKGWHINLRHQEAHQPLVKKTKGLIRGFNDRLE